jgi:succinyl-CoA synthetase beta subunit
VPCLVEDALEVRAEFYLSELIDPELLQRTILASQHGGQRVEREASDMIRIAIPYAASVANYQARLVARVWGLGGHSEASVAAALRGLHEAFCGEECRLIEINPLALAPDGRLVALDAKMVIDDNAIPRRADLSEVARTLVDSSAEARLRIKHGIEYVGLDGDIGLISGGAGMTMAAIDLIAHSGGRPRCFLDCSQNPTEAGYGTALQYLLDDPRTRTVLVNIVGGGTAVDEVAPIFVDLLSRKHLSKPVLIRLEGTGADRAREILTASGLRSYKSLEAMVTDALLAEPVQL